MTDSYEVYRYFLEQCRSITISDDFHSLYSQITELYIRDSDFRTINEARRLAIDAGRSTSGVVQHFVDLGFEYAQATAVRRMTEPYEPRPRFSIYSIPQVAGLIAQYRQVFTRANYVRAYCEIHKVTDGRAYWTGLANDAFNRLSCDEDAVAGDLISDKLLRKIENIHDDPSVKKVRNFTNKVIAHASMPHNRGELEGLSLNDMDAAYRTLSQMTHFLGSDFCLGPGLSVPVYIADVAKDFDVALSVKEDLPSLRKFLARRQAEMRTIFHA